MSDKRPLPLRVINTVMVVGYTAACVYLYYRFMGWESGSVYESDLPAHISLAVDDGLIYSLVSFLIIGLNKLNLMELLPMFLGIFACLSVMFTAFLIREITDDKWNRDLTELLALLLNIVMPCYIKGFSDGRYIGMHTSSIWHNSTYLLMKWMGLWTLLIYFKIEKNISKKMTVKSYLYFTLVLTLTTAAKPNFFLAVTPVMLVFLIMDLVSKKAPVSRLILFGSSVIPSFAVMLLQNSALYSVNAGDNKIVLAPGRAMSIHAGNLPAVIVLSIAFPLMMLALHFRDLFKEKVMLFAWLSAGVGFLEYFLLSEEGARNMDANFSWGYAFTIILIFGISLLVWIKDILAIKEKKTAIKAYLAVSGVVLLYHTYCGLLFFIRIVRGVSYMMWG